MASGSPKGMMLEGRRNNNAHVLLEAYLTHNRHVAPGETRNVYWHVISLYKGACKERRCKRFAISTTSSHMYGGF